MPDAFGNRNFLLAFLRRNLQYFSLLPESLRLLKISMRIMKFSTRYLQFSTRYHLQKSLR